MLILVIKPLLFNFDLDLEDGVDLANLSLIRVLVGKNNCLGGNIGNKPMVKDRQRHLTLTFSLISQVGQEQFSPSSPSWPPFMRVNPILDWSYRYLNCFMLSTLTNFSFPNVKGYLRSNFLYVFVGSS